MCAGALRTDSERGRTELKDRGSDGFGPPLADGPPRSGLPADAVPPPPAGQSPASDTAPGQVLANSRQVRTRLASAERGQALGDADDRVMVAKDLQGHFQPVHVIDRQQDSLSLRVTGQGDPLVLELYPPRHSSCRAWPRAAWSGRGAMGTVIVAG
jgi:hypothetical protein